MNIILDDNNKHKNSNLILCFINVAELHYIYRPQTKFAKVMFLLLSVSHSVHRDRVCLSACCDTPLPLRRTPPKQTPPQADNPWADTPLRQTPPQADNPWADTPPGRRPLGRHPPGSACWEIRATSGRYAQQAGGTHLLKCIHVFSIEE